MSLNALTDQLRALRMPDEAAVIVSVGSVHMRDCGPVGAIQVTVAKGKHSATVEALRLEDALLMARARIAEAEERDRIEREKAKQEKPA